MEKKLTHTRNFVIPNLQKITDMIDYKLRGSIIFCNENKYSNMGSWKQ